MNTSIIIAIDGMAASGKSTLAGEIQKNIDCNVFKTDDYFLPPQMKTKQRLCEIGGNIHYERFFEEIIQGILSQKPFDYFAYSCKDQKYTKKHAPKKSICIIEGSYSTHPYFARYLDRIIYMQTSEQKQIVRIIDRGQQDMLPMFLKLYIPLENIFFKHFKTKEKAYKVITT